MTPPLSPHTPHNSEFQIMSSSLSSPSSFLHSPHVQTITSLYQKTTQDFLLRNYDSAYSLCMTAISKLSKLSSEDPSTKVIQIKIWCLYISLIAALLAENPPINAKKHEIRRLIERTPEKVCEEVYTTIVTKGYNNEDGEIPGEIILACMLLCLHQKSFKLARQIFEDWHDSLPELTNKQLNHAAESAAVSSSSNPSSNPSSNGIKNDPLLKTYEKIVQLYLLHVLPNLKEWEKANSFLNKNTIINKERKQAYEQTLIRIKERSNKSLSSKHQHHKEKVSNGHFDHHINGNGNRFFYHRMDYEHKQSLLSSSGNKNKRLGGIHNIPRQLINNRFFMSPTGSRTSIMGVRKMITNNINDDDNNTTSNNISNNNDNNNDNNNHNNNSHHTTITASPETVMTMMLNRFRDTFCVYLRQASSNISIPKIIPFFIFIILLTSGWNKNFKSSLRGFMINGFAKFWETIKAGTTLTNV